MGKKKQAVAKQDAGQEPQAEKSSAQEPKKKTMTTTTVQSKQPEKLVPLVSKKQLLEETMPPLQLSGKKEEKGERKAGLMSTVRKTVLQGVFNAEIDKYLQKELSECGYAGVEVRGGFASVGTMDVIVKATKSKDVLGERGTRLKAITCALKKRSEGLGFKDRKMQLYVQRPVKNGLCASVQCESLRYKIEREMPVRRACYGVLRYIMEAGAVGAEIVVSGKIRGQRAKSMKFVDGTMIHSGESVRIYIDEAIRHIQAKAGVLGVRVKIMLPNEPAAGGPTEPLPDCIKVKDPPPERIHEQTPPYSQRFDKQTDDQSTTDVSRPPPDSNSARVAMMAEQMQRQPGAPQQSSMPTRGVYTVTGAS